MNIEIHYNGNAPTDKLFSNEDLLLIAAKAYNLQSAMEVHRLGLYSFIQTHLANKSEENLQKTLETNSNHWQSVGKGRYYLTKNGQSELSKFGIKSNFLSQSPVYIFNRIIDNHKISITVNPVKGKYECAMINDKESKSKEVIDFIHRIDSIRIPTNSTSLPRKIINWILSNNNYSWSIH